MTQRYESTSSNAQSPGTYACALCGRLAVLLRSVVSAMQPSRLIIGLLVVLSVATFGRGWDGLMGETVSPAGLDGGSVTDAEFQSQQLLYQAMLQQHTSETTWARFYDPDDGTKWRIISTQQMIEALRAAHSVQHDAIELEPIEPPDAAPSSDGDQAASGDEEGSEAAADAIPPNDDALERFERARRELNDRFIAALEQVDAARLKGVYEATSDAALAAFRSIVAAAMHLDPGLVIDGIVELVWHTPRNAWRVSPPFAVSLIAFLILALGFGGGAICRISMRQTAINERISLRRAFSESRVLWGRTIQAQIIPTIFVAVLAVLLLLAGVLARIPLLDTLAGLSFGVLLIIGFFAAFLATCYALAYPLLVPAVCAENCDGGDSMLRCYAYVANSPVRLSAYVLTAVAGLTVGYLVVAFFASLMLQFALGLMELGAGKSLLAAAPKFGVLELGAVAQRALPVTWHDSATSWLIELWLVVVFGLVMGYVVSYTYSAASTMYLLLRSDVDGQDISEVWLPERDATHTAPTSVTPETNSDDDAA